MIKISTTIKRVSRLAMTLALALTATAGWCQIVETPDYQSKIDSMRSYYDHQPYFSLFKDNYFTIGTVMGAKPTQHNSDVKFNISFKQRLTNSTLPFHSYLFLTYSQKCVWSVFENSLPMRDLNFNPGLGLSKLLFVKDRMIGSLTVMIEHESNGRDKLASRSWNKISFSGNIFVDPQLMIFAKYWIPIIDGENNRDILRYSGIYQSGFQAMSADNRFVMSMVFVKRKGWNLNVNTIVQLGVRLRKKDNQFLFMEYYNGYGETLLDYNKFRSRLRVGLLIRPRFFSDF